MKTEDLLKLSPDQLKIYTELQRIRMGWLTLYVVLGLFTIGFGAFLYALFFIHEQTLGKAITGGIDTLLGWALKDIVAYLFPAKKPSRTK